MPQATASLQQIVSALFTEPLLGFNRAQIQILDHWIKVLEKLKATPNATQNVIDTALRVAPKWVAAVNGDVSMVMRIANIKRFDASLSLGLSVGPFQAAGSFGFMSQSTSESVIQARATYVVTNDAGESSLLEMLQALGLPGQIGTNQVDEAITKLGELKSTLPVEKDTLPAEDA